MRKSLLLALFALLTYASATAVVDPNTYEPVNDIKIQNLWLIDRAHAADAFTNLDACNTNARMAVLSQGVVYVSRSQAKAIITGTDTVSAAVVYRFDANTGEELPALTLTYNGGYITAQLGANSIGVDNFGHLWMAPASFQSGTKIPLYALDGETGELSLVAELDKGDVLERIDYVDVMGDITREEAPCNVLAVGSQVATIYKWRCGQGEDYWDGGFDGDTYIDIVDFYPENVTQWGYAPYGKMILDFEDEENKYEGNLFYLDGFNSMPAIYDNTGSMVDNFENVPTELWPYAGTNGVAEFTLEGRNFLVYSKAQYDGLDEGANFYRACQANICELGEGMSLEGMTKYWQVPADKLGDVSDGGTRIHALNVEYAEEDGSEVVYLLTFKCYNGMGVYKIGKNLGGGGETPLRGDVNRDGKVNVTDVTTLINMILGVIPKDEEVADISGDGKINVTDVTSLINIILGVS